VDDEKSKSQSFCYEGSGNVKEMKEELDEV
jgi:hypothetical protein